MKRYIILILYILFSPSLKAQSWTTLGTYPLVPNADQPFYRGWQKPVFDPVDSGIIAYMANPNCCMGTFSNFLTVYRAKTNTWSALWSHGTTAAQATGAVPDSPTAPVDRHPYFGMTFDTNRNALWLIGGAGIIGSCGNANTCPDSEVDDLYTFAISTRTWNELCGYSSAACPSRWGSNEGSAVYDRASDSIFYYGGMIYGSPVQRMWRYSPSTGTYTKLCDGNCQIPGFDAPAMVSNGLGKILLFGGNNGLGNTAYTAIFDTATSKWAPVNSTLSPAPTKFAILDFVPRLNSAVLVNRPCSKPAELWQFDFTTLQWSNLNVSGGPVLDCSNPQSSAGAYDPGVDAMVVFAGYPGNTPQIYSAALPGGITPPPPAQGSLTLSTVMASSSSIAFSVGAPQQVGQPASVSLVLINSGQGALAIQGLTITGPNAGDFSVTSNCPGTLAIGQSCAATVSFTPSVTSPESASLTISNDSTAGPQTVQLSGNGG